MTYPEKPLGQKAYGSIPHLPGSRRGPGDYGLSESQARICTDKARDKHDLIIVQEKLDGSCVSVAKINGEIVPLIRRGYRAITSNFTQHHHFHHWAMDNRNRFLELLRDGERACGEWLMEAHGTRYNLPHEPFVLFDIIKGHERMPVNKLLTMAAVVRDFTMPKLIHMGGPISIQDVLSKLEPSGHGAIDPVEGAVWRVERQGKVDFLGKYVRPDKVDGCYLKEISGKEAVYNWKPSDL